MLTQVGTDFVADLAALAVYEQTSSQVNATFSLSAGQVGVIQFVFPVGVDAGATVLASASGASSSVLSLWRMQQGLAAASTHSLALR